MTGEAGARIVGGTIGMVKVSVMDLNGFPLGEWYTLDDGTHYRLPSDHWTTQVEAIHYQVAKRWSAGSEEDIHFLALALCGEAGELANLIKKCWRGDRSLRNAEVDLAEELADVRIYLELLASMLKIDLDAAVCAKLPELYARWPECITKEMQP